MRAFEFILSHQIFMTDYDIFSRINRYFKCYAFTKCNAFTCNTIQQTCHDLPPLKVDLYMIFKKIVFSLILFISLPFYLSAENDNTKKACSS